MPRVLVLGARAPVALDHARRFRAQGWEVLAGDSRSCRLTSMSNRVAGVVALPPPRHAPDAFAAALARAVQAHRIDLVLPTCEEVFFVAQARARLPAHVRVPVPDIAVLRELHSKWTALPLARAAGLRVPDAARVHSLAEARAWAGADPVVLKPEFSRFGTHVRVHPHGLPADAPPLADVGAWVAQRYIDGDETCSYGIADRGRLLAHVAYRPRYRLGASASFYFDPVDDAPIRAGVATLVRQLDYTGQVAFDWRADADGVPVMLECNPRAVSGLHLFAPTDPLPAALMGEGGATFGPGNPRAAMLAAMMLGVGLPHALARGRVGEWSRDWRRADDVLAQRGDRKPLLGACVDMASFARLALAEGCSVREAATRDIEWDGDAVAAP